MKETINLINETKVKQWLDEKSFNTKRYYELEDKKRNNRTSDEQAEYEELEKERNKILEPLGKELVEYFKNQPPQNKEKIQHNLRKKKLAQTFATAAIRNISDIRPLLLDFVENHPFFYDKNKIWWVWSNMDCNYSIVDETDLLSQFDSMMGTSSISLRSSAKAEILEGLKRVGRQNIPIPAPNKWVQFKDKAFSITSRELHNVTPEYFFTNPIPHPIGETSDTPILDDLFSQWVGEAHKQTLYELVAYCTYTAYPIQLIFCLWGSGANGKSQFLRILEKFLGIDNCASASLDRLIDNKFEAFNLYKKLACFIGETNFGIIKNTDMLKKLVDGSMLSFEMKNKMPFQDRNHAKVIIASNSLPSSLDTSDGFYRRWYVIDWPNQFEETGQEVWKTVPESEYAALAKKVTEILPTLLSRGTFTGQGSLKQRKERYLSVSNPFSLFLSESCKVGDELRCKYSVFYAAYLKYLARNKRRRIGRKEFAACLDDEGLYKEKNTFKDDDGVLQSAWWVMGVRLLNDQSDKKDYTSIPHTHKENSIEQEYLGHFSHSEFVFSSDDRNKVYEIMKVKPYTHFKEIEEHFGDGSRVEALLKQMSSEGLIFSPKPEVWKVVE